MKVFHLIVLFFGAFLVEAAFHLPLKIHNVSKETLKLRQKSQMEQFNKIGQKLLESKFKNDYITASIEIGTPKKNYTVAISSGSSRFWLFDTHYNKASSTQHLYNASASSTSQNLNTSFFEIDGSYEIQGNYFIDEFSFEFFYTVNQSFGSVSKSKDFDMENLLFPVDGSMGLNHFIPLAYEDGTEKKALIDNLLENEPQKMYTIYLPAYKLTSPFQEGIIAFGAFDNSHCQTEGTKEFKLAESTQDKRYVINMNGFGYGPKTIQKGGTAFLDTGVSNIWLEYGAFYDIVKKTNVSYDFQYSLYTYKCSQRNELEQITFYFENEAPNNMVQLKPEDYIIDIGIGNDDCALMLETGNAEYLESYVLGSVFMRKVCTKVDIKENTVSFHKHL